MCCAFNDSGLKRFMHDFYCVRPKILEMVLVPKNLIDFEDGPTPMYVGLGEHFGADTRYFDKGRFIEDIAQVAILMYKPTQKGLPCTYASIPIQPNRTPSSYTSWK
ncbi:uncharacterized protein [Arachis hypogaea]|uniref:uncharacterized protein isoform X2 n=1 Tax=Arachis hypogaea TaxID=3818 RepID=UPI000DED8EB9